MAVKLLVSGESGAGKTDLLGTLDETAFIVSRDAKKFGFKLPHMLVESWQGVDQFLYGYDTTEGRVDGLCDKMEKYKEKYGVYPTTIVFDTVSQIFMDIMEKAYEKPNVYGSQGVEISHELAKFVKFLHESLELGGIHVIIMNHVIEERADGKPTGDLISFGTGKFLQKGGFYATTNEAVTVVADGENRKVYLRDKNKQARTTLKYLPRTQWVENTVDPEKSKKLKEGEEYFSLKKHLDLLIAEQTSVEEWAI